MKERIRKFIIYKNITAADLADKLEVQRSNVSHILNGRNKPGANFIERLLIEYPELNARWLLTGEGEMIFSKKEQVKTLFDTSEFIQPKEELNQGNGKKISQPAITDSKPDEMILSMAKTNKQIDKIVIFYTDKSFAVYNPE